ncbi:hypothetical protein M3P05_05270 [Sansalvadorimonas sp. 2012CJ34-2]|uniref:Uncharacterized protein n=1 Tax=Parendozoicomonas callyspongiae TaxID=2942213 RepID=A0ABT0PDB6_9GAMM|nr:hypothetical protein [Sansalvadorimonas sp. 2012CJ34-2]MCL6269355.1 hypothetical protein [Sansalvadorimonas sp. 2012CJ34-2]
MPKALTRTIISRLNPFLTLTAILAAVLLVLYLEQLDASSMAQITVTENHKPNSPHFLNEYEVKGPFSGPESQETAHLELSCCNKTSEHFEQSLIITKGSAQLIEEGQTVSFSGVCLTQDARLALLVYNWDGSPTLGGIKSAHLFNPVTREFEGYELESYIDTGFEEGIPLGSHELIQCDYDEQLFPRDGKPFKPCYCNLEPLEQEEELNIEIDAFLGPEDNLVISDFEDAFFAGTPHEVDYRIVGAEQVRKLVSIIEEADALPFSVKQLENDKREVLSIIYNRPVYHSFSALLTREKDAPEWLLIYRATPSSKGFHPQFLEELHKDSRISVTLCTEDCTWWGRRFSSVDIVVNKDKVNMYYRSDIEEEL